MDSIQTPDQILESIARHFSNDRPIKMETFCQLTTSLKQHFKVKVESGTSNINNEDDVSNLITLVHSVVGINSEAIDQDHNSLQASLSGKDPELIILSGKQNIS